MRVMYLPQATINSIEGRAYDILIDAYGDNSQIAPPIDITKVLKKYSLQLKMGEFSQPDVLGTFDRKAMTIGVSKTDPLVRQIFTIAHEMGHYFLHEKKSREVFYRLEALNFEQEDKQEEQEANWFAASLLMPRELTEQYWSVVRDIDQLAAIFRVSRSAMTFRLKNLGLID